MNDWGSAIVVVHLKWHSHPSQRTHTNCRCKMRMSGLSKVEMSAFIGGRGRYGNGANRLEPTRTRPATCVTRDQAQADQPDRSGPASEDQRSAHPPIAGCCGETR